MWQRGWKESYRTDPAGSPNRCGRRSALQLTRDCQGLVRTAKITLVSGESRALAPQAALLNSGGKRLSTNVVLRGFPSFFVGAATRLVFPKPNELTSSGLSGFRFGHPSNTRT